MLIPKVQQMRDKLLSTAKLVGINLIVTSGYRSHAEQDKLYAQGRTEKGQIVTNAKGGESFHNYGLAFDVAFLRDGKISYEGNWWLVGWIGKMIGLSWGGDWHNFKDRPHFEYTANYSIEDFKKGRVDFTKFL
jgi:peptidoglycan L-alanyl-D-glutamate endopeptidase CwlK